MRLVRTDRLWLRALCMAGVVMAATGCVKEGLDDCTEKYNFMVRAYTDTGNPADDHVQEVILYVFDRDNRFIQEIETEVNTPVVINDPKGQGLHIHAWGNLNGGRQVRPVLNVGSPDTSPYVSLLPDTRAAANYLSPDDLFRGEITLAPAGRLSGTVEIPVYRQTAGMSITAKGLKLYAGYDDNNYSIAVRDTYSSVDFYGNLWGERAVYHPAGSFVTENGNTNYTVPAFNLLPEHNGVSIDILHGTTLVKTVSSYDGYPIALWKGKLTQVVIDFTGTITVSITTVPWGTQGGGKEF